MKKLLLASTALVASTTFAMADVDLSGSAEMGVMGMSDSDVAVQDRDLEFHTDIDVTFSMSGETDAGLTFGASVDIDEQIGDNNADDGGAESGATRDDSDDGGATIFVSGNFGTLTMGDTDGAFDWALSEAIIGSSLADDHEHGGYSGNGGLDELYDGQVVRYDYSFGDFAVGISFEIDDTANATTTSASLTRDGDPAFGIGATYSGDFGGLDIGLGIGYQSVSLDEVATPVTPATTPPTATLGGPVDYDILGVSASVGTAGGLQGIINYSDLDGFGGNDDHLGLAIGYTFGELLVAANYGVFDKTAGGEDEGYGLIANYDLGGGASLQAGYGNSDNADGTDVDSYSFGIAMSF